MSKIYSYPKEYKILKRSDFLSLKKSGMTKITPFFIFVFKKTNFPFSRVGITVTKRIGNAVIRNTIKRIIREEYRLSASSITNSYDISIIVKKNFLNSRKEVRMVLASLLTDDIE